MAYFTPELDFAKGYYHIKADGTVVLKDNTPEDVRDKFWKVWKEFHKKVADMQRNGVFRSAYPVLPMEDTEQNKRNYR